MIPEKISRIAVRKWTRLRLYFMTGMAITGVIALSSGLAHAQTAPLNQGATITVYTGRPLCDALMPVQDLLGTPSNYEEVPLENRAEMHRVTVADPAGV